MSVARIKIKERRTMLSILGVFFIASMGDRACAYRSYPWGVGGRQSIISGFQSAPPSRRPAMYMVKRSNEPQLGGGLDPSAFNRQSSPSPSSPSEKGLGGHPMPDMTMLERFQVSSVPPTDLSQDKELLEDVTKLLYDALNERNVDILAKIWHDDESVLFFAGGNMTRGYSEVMDMYRKVRQEERKLDPNRKGLMLHPTVKISDLRVVVNGIHAWVTCKETMTRGLIKEMPAPEGPFLATNLFRKFNGQWRMQMHWSGRLAPIQDQLELYIESKKMTKGAKQGTRGPGMNIGPEQLGLPTGFSLGPDDEISFEWDDDDEEDDDGEGASIEITGPAGSVEAEIEGLFNHPSLSRLAVFRQKTKKALAAVRRLFKDGHITRAEKIKLIYSVIHSTSQDEISQVEMAYDLLVAKNVATGGPEQAMEEFCDQCKMFLAESSYGL